MRGLECLPAGKQGCNGGFCARGASARGGNSHYPDQISIWRIADSKKQKQSKIAAISCRYFIIYQLLNLLKNLIIPPHHTAPANRKQFLRRPRH